MISISRLLCGTVSPGDSLRYRDSQQAQKVADTGPVVVWNCTRQCNLHCIHCYAGSSSQAETPSMNTKQGMQFIDDLAEFNVPVILFSGGEPLLRDDLFDLAGYAARRGLRIALSTNGTLIDAQTADKIRETGFAEVGISLDGTSSTNDRFRGRDGAYRQALEGIRACVARGIRVSLRLTITKYNHTEIPDMFSLIEQENINRVCFYHLAYSGRGDSLREQDLTHSEKRRVLDMICDRTLEMHRRGHPREVLTVGNHADGVYLYLRAQEQGHEGAGRIRELLKMNGGNNSGIRIGAVDDKGDVHPDQFWQSYSPGNVLERKFGDIWMDMSQPVMKGLKNRKHLLKGRCARCAHLDLCNGNLRVRAEAVHGDMWAEDPACYLSDREIGLTK
ncbi:MAG: radical SAM protein [Dehalococcoidia bacterium]